MSRASRMISLTVTIEIDQYQLIEEWGKVYGLTFSQALREFIQKGKAHELSRQAQEKLDYVDNTTEKSEPE